MVDQDSPKTEQIGIIELWKVTIEDIERSKKRQWNIFIYSIIALAGLFTLFRDVESCIYKCPQFVIFVTISAILGIIAIYYVIESQAAIENFRKREKELRAKFISNDIKNIMDNSYRPPNKSICPLISTGIALTVILLVVAYAVKLFS